MDFTEQEMIGSFLDETLEVTSRFVREPEFKTVLQSVADAICASLSTGGKLLVAGNGGSAGDAQHIAGEFMSRLFCDREPLAAIALTTDTSVITAIGNDYGFERVFERQVLALGNPGDVFLAITTSGTSTNIVRALEAARRKGLVSLGFTGEKAGPLDGICDVVLHAPSNKTALVQQVHITAAHIVCGLVEKRLCTPGTGSGA